MPYVGLLGPAARREKLLADLGADAARLRAALRAPVGLDIGGRAPSPSRCPSSARYTRSSPVAAAALSAKWRSTGIMSGNLADSLIELMPRCVSRRPVLAGFVAGMLGVGGGIVTVPVLEYSLRFAGVPEEYRMHVAVATSLAAIIPTSISSARTHHAQGRGGLAARETLGRAHGASARVRWQPAASHAPLSVLAGVFGTRGAADRRQDAAAARSLAFAEHVPRGAPAACCCRR